MWKKAFVRPLVDPSSYDVVDEEGDFLKLQLEWDNVSYSVASKQKRKDGDPWYTYFNRFVKKQQTTILSNITGYVSPGSVLAIMGPSGAGKSTFLNILAHRAKAASGLVSVNGTKVGKFLRSVVSFVEQDDVLFSNMTVKETLRYNALLTLPQLTREQRNKRVDDVLEELGLTKCAHVYIGKPGYTKGISGGEKRRLSIALGLLSSPSILFLDEPTSGLDSRTAENVMQTICRLAKNGRAIVLTIHQPRSSIVKLFDRLLILSKGRTAYFGKAADLTSYFASIPPMPEHDDPDMFICPTDYNPTDWVIDLVTEGRSSDRERFLDRIRIDYVLDYYQQNNTCEIPGTDNDASHLKRKKLFETSWFRKTLILFVRSFVNTWRDPLLAGVRLFQSILFALIIGAMFFRLGRDQKGIQDRVGALFMLVIINGMQPLFASAVFWLSEEKAVVTRERAAKMYKVSSYLAARCLAELSHSVIWPVVLNSIAYYMMGLNPKPERFFTLLLCGIVITILCASYGFMIGVVSSSMNEANSYIHFIFIVYCASAGFYTTEDSIFKGMLWLYWSSFYRFALESVIINEMKGSKFSCDSSLPKSLCFAETGEQVLHMRGFDKPYSGTWIAMAIMLGYSALLQLIAFILVRRKKGNK